MRRNPTLLAVLAIVCAAEAARASEPEPQLGAFSRIVLPTSANVGGQGGTFYRTKMSILNVSSAAYDLEVVLYGASGQVGVRTVHLGSKAAANFANVLADLFAFTGAGALVLDSHGLGEFIATDEVFNDKAGCGRFKTVVTGGPILEPSLPGFDSFSIGLTVDGDNRTNYGIFNDSDTDNGVSLDVYNGSGAFVRTINHTIPRKTWFQTGLSDPISGGFIRWRVTGLAYLWAVTVSNDSGDGTFIPAADVVPSQ
jgi:hypothetical protein